MKTSILSRLLSTIGRRPAFVATLPIALPMILLLAGQRVQAQSQNAPFTLIREVGASKTISADAMEPGMLWVKPAVVNAFRDASGVVRLPEPNQTIRVADGESQWDFHVSDVVAGATATFIHAQQDMTQLMLTVRNGRVELGTIRDYLTGEIVEIHPGENGHILTKRLRQRDEAFPECMLDHDHDRAHGGASAKEVARSGLPGEAHPPTMAENENEITIIDAVIAVNDDYLESLIQMASLRAFANRHDIQTPSIPAGLQGAEREAYIRNIYQEEVMSLPNNGEVLLAWMEEFMETLNQTLRQSDTRTVVRFMGFEPIDTTGFSSNQIAWYTNPDDGSISDADGRRTAIRMIQDQVKETYSMRTRTGADLVIGILDWGPCGLSTCGVAYLPFRQLTDWSDPDRYLFEVDVQQSADNTFTSVFANNHVWTYGYSRHTTFSPKSRSEDGTVTEIQVRHGLTGITDTWPVKDPILTWEMIEEGCESWLGGELTASGERGEPSCRTWPLVDGYGRRYNPSPLLAKISIDYLTFQHEFGHSLGIRHSRSQTKNPSSYDQSTLWADYNSVGNQQCWENTSDPVGVASSEGTAANCYASLVAYPETNMPRVPYFSSPRIIYTDQGSFYSEVDAASTGRPYRSFGHSDSIDAVSAIRKNKSYIARYREATGFVPSYYNSSIPYNPDRTVPTVTDACGGTGAAFDALIQIPCLWAGRFYEVMNPQDIVAHVFQFRNIAANPANYRIRARLSSPIATKEAASSAFGTLDPMAGSPWSADQIREWSSLEDRIAGPGASSAIEAAKADAGVLMDQGFESFGTGEFYHQKGWIAHQGAEFRIANTAPAEGKQHLVIPSTTVGTVVFAPHLGQPEEGAFEVYMDLLLPTGSGKADADVHQIYLFNAPDGTMPASVAIEGEMIRPYDPNIGAYVTGASFKRDTYQQLSITFDPLDRMVRYWLDGMEFGSYPLPGDVTIDRLVFHSLDKGGSSSLHVDRVLVGRPRYSALVDFSSLTGYLEPGETGSLLMTFTPDGLAEGTYEIELAFHLDDREKELFSTTVELSVSGKTTRLGEVALASPSDQAFSVNREEGQLAWNAVAGATGYHVMIGTGDAFIGDDVVVDDTVGGLEYPLKGLLDQNRMYHWKVRALQSTTSSAGSWSPTWRFTSASTALGSRSVYLEAGQALLDDEKELTLYTDPLGESDGLTSYSVVLEIPDGLAFVGIDTVGTMSQSGVHSVSVKQDWLDEAASDIVTIQFAASKPIKGSGDLLTIRLRTEKAANYLIPIQSVTYNDLTLAIISGGGLYVFPHRTGDVDANGLWQAYDAGLALHYSVGLDVLPEVDPLPWSNWRVMAADVDRDGKVLAIDGANILAKVAGHLEDFSELRSKGVSTPQGGSGGSDGIGSTTASTASADSPAKASAAWIDGHLQVSASGAGLRGLNITLPRREGVVYGEPRLMAGGALLSWNPDGDSVAIAVLSLTPLTGEVLRLPLDLEADAELSLAMHSDAFGHEEVVRALATSLDLSPGIPTAFALEPNYPNPFNPTTVIRYALPMATHVRLEVFNITGQRVAVLAQGDRPAGFHQVSFDASGLSSGVYVYRISSAHYTASRRMLLIK